MKESLNGDPRYTDDYSDDESIMTEMKSVDN